LTPLVSAETGLRRRTQTRSNSNNDGGIMEETNNTIQDQEDDTETADLSATSRMAQNIALLHQERRRRHEEQRDRESDLCNQRGLYTFMRFSFLFAMWHMVVLVCLHFTYVGPRISKTLHTNDGITSTKSSSFQQTCIESALSTRPEEERSNFFRMSEEQGITEEHDRGIFPLNRNDMQFIGNSTSANTTVPLLGRDEILQIKVIYDNKCGENDCSRVRNVIPSKDDSNKTTKTLKNWKLWSHLGQAFNANDHDDSSNDTQKHVDSHYASESYWKEPHYKFSNNEALMFLDDNMLRYHNVSIVNITLTERCLSTGHDQGSYSKLTSFAQFLSQFYGMDTILMNQVMYGIKTEDGDFRNGYLHNLQTNERWAYSRHQLKQEVENNHGMYLWLMNRFSVMIASLLAFAMITSLTALIIRVLTTSGVMLFFPIFSYLRRLGVHGLNERILEYSYPWVGVARRVIRRTGNYPEKYFIWAHLGKVFVLYTMYESCQYAFSSFLYGKSIPEGLPIWIFGFAMLLEYFSMIFVRSAVSVYFFPRMTLLYFLGYHFYFYSVPYGCFDVAILMWTGLMVHLMVYVVLALEIPAFARGAVSIEFPREVYSKLSWPEFTAAIPNEWTLFLPLNSRYIPVHDRDVFEGQLGGNDEHVNPTHDGGSDQIMATNDQLV
jgi:hypothetical protein